jgi:hypothetical protein
MVHDLENLDATILQFEFDPAFPVETIKPKAFRPPVDWANRGELTRLSSRFSAIHRAPYEPGHCLELLIERALHKSDQRLLRIMTNLAATHIVDLAEQLAKPYAREFGDIPVTTMLNSNVRTFEVRHSARRGYYGGCTATGRGERKIQRNNRPHSPLRHPLRPREGGRRGKRRWIEVWSSVDLVSHNSNSLPCRWFELAPTNANRQSAVLGLRSYFSLARGSFTFSSAGR